MHYYKNNEMFPTCKKEHSLKKENYLSEFVTTNQKEFARDNLGITDIINSLDKKIWEEENVNSKWSYYQIWKKNFI